MRYIGSIASSIKEKELNHLKVLLEKEAVLRSAKHLFNKYLRESSDTYTSSVISHLLNILVAPFPFIEKLNE